MPVCYFSIIGPGDACIYEYGRISEGGVPAGGGGSPAGSAAASSIASPTSSMSTTASGVPLDTLQLSRQFMAHSSLDLVEEAMWSRPDLYLTKVDRFDESKYFVSAFVGFGPLKLLLMQDTEPHDNVRPFFSEAFELCTKYLSNPFASATQPIRNREFEERLVGIYNKYF
jgi:hypothetical protein